MTSSPQWTVWDGGLAASLSLPVTSSLTNWAVGLEFSQPWQQIDFFKAQTNQTTGREFSVRNHDWSGNKE